MTRNPRRGFPSNVMLSLSFQSGCGIIPTLYPKDSKTLLIIACPNDEWSTYASPVIYTKSHCSQPLFSISDRLTGRKSLIILILHSVTSNECIHLFFQLQLYNSSTSFCVKVLYSPGFNVSSSTRLPILNLLRYKTSLPTASNILFIW